MPIKYVYIKIICPNYTIFKCKIIFEIAII